ncbi:MAG: hypothetical protein WBA74_24120, partial [Cyclobacteriaceae bacterium]
MLHAISISKKFEPQKVYNEDVDLEKWLKTLTTKLLKENAPLWCMGRIKDTRSNLPTHVSGMIIDYDHPIPPEVNDAVNYYYHQTHSKHWRYIVPFDKNYQFSTATDYKKVYFDLIDILFYDAKKLIKEKKIDVSCAHPNRFFYLRYHEFPLKKNEGKIFKPKFCYYNKEILKADLLKIKLINYERQPLKAIKILLRIENFIRCYQFTLKWFFLNIDLKKCVFDWHDNHNGDAYFNEATQSYPANIYCHHSTCNDKLKFFMAPYQPDQDPDLKIKRTIKDITVLYLAAAVIKGLFAIEQIEACGLYCQEKMVYNIDKLKYLKFDAKLDAPLWQIIYHDSAVIKRGEGFIYNYKDGYYQRIINENEIIYDYDVSLGTYVKYKHPKLSIKTYIEHILHHSKGYMMQNFENIKESEGMVLNNGILMLEKNGRYSFTPHSPTYFFTTKMDIDFNENEKCPLWEKTL